MKKIIILGNCGAGKSTLARELGRVRLDMAEGCPEKFDLEFIEYVATYRRKRKPEVMEKIAVYKDKVRFVTLKNPQEVAEFVRSLGDIGYL